MQKRPRLYGVVRMHCKTVVVIVTVNVVLASCVQAIVWGPEDKGASCRGKQLTPGMVEYSMDQEYNV